mgnify:CR=1 FL=1
MEVQEQKNPSVRRACTQLRAAETPSSRAQSTNQALKIVSAARTKMRALLLAACLVTTTNSDGPPRKRLRGAVREIGDVQDELVRSEHRARRVERDLDVVLSAFSNGTRAFARRRRRSGSRPS